MLRQLPLVLLLLALLLTASLGGGFFDGS